LLPRRQPAAAALRAQFGLDLTPAKKSVEFLIIEETEDTGGMSDKQYDR